MANATLTAIKHLLEVHYPKADYKVTVKEVPDRIVKSRVYPYTRSIGAFVNVAVEVRLANSENWKGQARKRHPDEQAVLAILRSAGHKAVLHPSAAGPQGIAIMEVA